MNKLIIFHDDESSFDPGEVRKLLEDIPGTRQIKEGPDGARLWCGFDFNGDKTTVQLAQDLKAISVHGTGDASLQMALQIQKRHSPPLRVTDLDYGFDLFLGEIGSVEDFDKKIRDAYAFPDTV